MDKYKQWYVANERGQKLEKAGRVADAVQVYEEAVESGTDTPFTYRRLAIIYRRHKNYEDEIRVCRLALRNVAYSDKKQAIFEGRIDRARELRDKYPDREVEPIKNERRGITKGCLSALIPFL